MRRREFLTLPAGSLGGVLMYALSGEAIRLTAQVKAGQSNGTVRVPLKFFSEAEAHVIAAAAERIFPGDSTGPGAGEAGVVVYIDRQLAGPYGRDKYRYTKGPWVESMPEHGYQGRANPQQIYREGLRMLEGFVALSPTEQDARLAGIEKSVFFQMLRIHTMEGMFCDPLHGGNAGMIGWQMIGYPGPLMSFREDLEKYRGVVYKKAPKSLSQVVGRAVKGWEEEIG